MTTQEYDSATSRLIIAEATTLRTELTNAGFAYEVQGCVALLTDALEAAARGASGLQPDVRARFLTQEAERLRAILREDCPARAAKVRINTYQRMNLYTATLGRAERQRAAQADFDAQARRDERSAATYAARSAVLRARAEADRAELEAANARRAGEVWGAGDEEDDYEEAVE
jgi:hypothetical protein